MLVEEGIEAAVDAIIHAMADRVSGEPEEALEGSPTAGVLALGQRTMATDPNMVEAMIIGDGADVPEDSRMASGTAWAGTVEAPRVEG